MTAVVVAIMILVSKRRRKNLSTTGSSIYSGPYTNTAYSHSSISRRSWAWESGQEWSWIFRNNQDIIPSPVITISNPKMLIRSCRNDPILPLVVNFRAYFLPPPKIHSSSIPAFLLWYSDHSSPLHQSHISAILTTCSALDKKRLVYIRPTCQQI